MLKTKTPNRILYSLKASWQHRRALKTYIDNPYLQIKTLTDLNLSRLQMENIQVLVLDFDGVLGPDHAEQPLAKFIPWLDEMYQHFQAQLFIFSNKPLASRAHFFQTRYPKIEFIKNVAKKPFPDGLNLIRTKTGLSGAQILLCDDRLLTGILAAELAEIKAFWVTEPCRNFIGRFWHELFFTLLRFLDKNFIRLSA